MFIQVPASILPESNIYGYLWTSMDGGDWGRGQAIQSPAKAGTQGLSPSGRWRDWQMAVSCRAVWDFTAVFGSGELTSLR